MEADRSAEPNNHPDDDSRKIFFYGEPQRLQCLNFLLHLAPYSNETLLITGGIGSGKTVILRQFIQKGGDAWRTCYMAGETLAGVNDLLHALEARFSIRPLEGAARTEQIQVLVEEFQAVQKRNQRVVLIVDDAHKASADALAFLDQLQEGLHRAGDGVSLVLTGDAPFASHPEVENLRARGMHAFELTSLSLEETENYLRNFLRKNGMPTDTLSSGEMKRIYKEAKGNFGMTFSLARSAIGKGRHRVLVTDAEKPETAPLAAPEHQRDIVVPRSRYLVPLLLLLAFALVVANQFGSLPLPDWLSTAERPVVPEAPPPVVEEAPSLHALEEEYAPVTQPGPPEAVTDVFDRLALEDQTTEAEPSEELEVPPTPPIEEGVEVAPPEPEEPAQPTAPPVAVPPPPSAGAVIAPIAPPIPLPEPPKQAAPTPEPVAPEAPKAPEAGTSTLPPPTAEPGPAAPAEPSPVPVGPRDETWLLTQDEKKYTLQIMALNSDKVFRNMLAKVEDPRVFAIYRLVRNGKVLYALVYGVFDSVAAAQAAAAELPKSFGKVSPLPKRLRDIHKDIRAVPK